MQAITFIRELEGLQKTVIGLSDVTKIIGKGRDYAKVYVNRLAKRNLLHEVEKGKYTLSEDPHEIGSNLVFPSYISFITAYSLYSFTTQIPIIAQIVSPKSKKTLKIDKTKIIFIKFKKENIFGYHREKFRKKYMFIAEPEKAIIDSLYLPEQCPISESYQALGENIDISKLVEYALRMSSIVTIKRLGYLLELHGQDIYDKVAHMLNKKYDLLNPFMKKSKINSSKWKLNVNEVFESE